MKVNKSIITVCFIHRIGRNARATMITLQDISRIRGRDYSLLLIRLQCFSSGKFLILGCTSESQATIAEQSFFKIVNEN